MPVAAALNQRLGGNGIEAFVGLRGIVEAHRRLLLAAAYHLEGDAVGALIGEIGVQAAPQANSGDHLGRVRGHRQPRDVAVPDIGGRENRAVRRRGEGEPGGRGVGGAGLPKREGKQRDQDNRTMNPHVSPSYARSILTAHRCLRAYLDFVAKGSPWERDRLARPIGVPHPGSASILLAPVSGSRAGNRVVAPGGSGGWVGRPWRWRASASRVPTCGCLALPRRWRSEARL